MAGTQETGLDFVDRITAEIRALQNEVAGLHKKDAELRVAINSEAAGRETDIAKLSDRISRERDAETHLRTVLEKRLEDFETKSKSWIGALGKDCLATKEQLAALEGTVKANAATAAAQVMQDDKRFKDIEKELPDKSTWTGLHKLEADVATLKTDVERNRSTLQADLRSVADVAARDFKGAQDSIECVKAQAVALEKQAAIYGREAALTHQELVRFKNRLEALEVAFPMKAEAGEIPKMLLKISDSNERHEAMYRRAQEHGMRIDRIDGAIHCHSRKLEGLEQDVKITAVHALPLMDHTSRYRSLDLSKDFYRKEEIDAMLSRAGRRAGDIARGSPMPVPLSARY